MVTLGLTTSLVLGTPLGTLIGSTWGWRSTMSILAALGTLAALIITLRLPSVASGGAIGLRKRLVPQPGNAEFDTLHASLIDRLMPVCTRLLQAAADAGEIRSDIEAYELMRGVGNLCIGAADDPRYDAPRSRTPHRRTPPAGRPSARQLAKDGPFTGMDHRYCANRRASPRPLS